MCDLATVYAIARIHKQRDRRMWGVGVGGGREVCTIYTVHSYLY